MIEERFADGNMAPVVRIGAAVHRSGLAWGAASAAVLRHLEAVGFDGAPRFLGHDESGREILSYIPGVSGAADLTGIAGDDALAGVANLLRRYHDAIATFTPPAAIVWPRMLHAPDRGPVICHNDIAPWNTIFTGTQPVAIIDWDLVAPGPVEWDIAYALWRFAPLYPDERYGDAAERARRIVLFCDAYGLARRDGLIDLIPRRQRSAVETVEVWGAAGQPGFAHLYEARLHLGELDDMAFVRRHRSDLVRAVERSTHTI